MHSLFWMQLTRNESESKFGKEKKCKGESWNEFHIRTTLLKCKRKSMRSEERSFNMRTNTLEGSNEYFLVKIHWDRNDMRNYWISQPRSYPLLKRKKFSCQLPRVQLKRFLKINLCQISFLMLEPNQPNLKRILSWKRH